MIQTAARELPAPKRHQILSGARQVFAELGYERASVDVIASRAGVSKATVYNHFADKEALFVACSMEEAAEMRQALEASIAAPGGELVQALQAIGEQLVQFLISPPAVALYRHTIAEAARLPEVGATVHERGPKVIYDAVAARLACWHDQGVLRTDEPRWAAIHFLKLCEADLVLRARFGVLPHPSRAEVREAVRRGVEAFLRAYGA
jgi:TetR/AcrR family transcriptional regulator, mexJK operon transcriptional repressor